MKIRILGFLFVFGILGALYVLTGGDQQTLQPVQIQQSSPSDADFKTLKIQ